MFFALFFLEHRTSYNMDIFQLTPHIPLEKVTKRPNGKNKQKNTFVAHFIVEWNMARLRCEHWTETIFFTRSTNNTRNIKIEGYDGESENCEIAHNDAYVSLNLSALYNVEKKENMVWSYEDKTKEKKKKTNETHVT